MLLRRISFVPVLSLMVALSVPSFSWGQGFLSTSMTRQMGLTRVWQTQVDFDRGHTRLAGVYMHVSPTRVYTVFEVPHKGRIFRFSELELDAYGVKIGVEEAKKRALDKLAALKADIAAAGSKEPVPVMETHVVPEITIYASSHSGTLHAIDGETGLTRWSISVGNPDFPTSAPGANNEFVSIVNGSNLYVVKAEDGTVAFQRRTSGAPAAGPGVTAAYIYVPGITGAVEVFEINKPTYPTKTFFSNGRTLLQPIATERTAAWMTDKGVLYSANGRTPGMRFRLELPGGSATSPAILYPDRLIAASDNGHLYCTHEARGNVLWRLSTGESITRSPFAINNTAYLLTDRGGLFAVDGDSGREKWWISGVYGFLAGTKDRLYLTDLEGNIVVVNSDTGAKMGTIPASGLDYRFQNVFTDRIILGSSTGSLQMYREAARTWPLVHRGEEEKERPAEVMLTPAGDAGGEPMPLGQPPAADPFGGPANDPFGGDGDKPAEPMMPAADPFDPFK